MIGQDYAMKILDWIVFAKIFDPFNTTVYGVILIKYPFTQCCYKAEVGPGPYYRGRLRQDSAFFFRIRSRSQKFVKKRTRIRCHFSISAVESVRSFLGKNMVKITVGSMIVARVWTGVGFSNLKNSRTRMRTRIQKFWNRSGVRVWKNYPGHLCYKDKLWNHSCMDAINGPKRLIYRLGRRQSSATMGPNVESFVA